MDYSVTERLGIRRPHACQLCISPKTALKKQEACPNQTGDKDTHAFFEKLFEKIIQAVPENAVLSTHR